jgi:hypothetical protein
MTEYNLGFALFYAFTWFPVVSGLLGIIFSIWAFVAYRKGKKYKGLRNTGFVFLGLVLLHILLLFIIGAIGIGPGLSG